MNFTLLDLLVLSGIVLSLFLVSLIFGSKSFRGDIHGYFAITIISLNFYLTYTRFEAYVPSNGIMELVSWDLLFPFAFLMYTLKVIKHPLGANKKIWLLALPFLILRIFQIVDIFFDFDVYVCLAGGRDEQLAMLVEMRVFSFMPYSIALVGFSYVKIREAKNLYRSEKQWLAFNSIAILAFLISCLFSDFISALFDYPIWEYLLASLAVFLIVTTYRGIHHLNISEQRRQLRAVNYLEKINQEKKLSLASAKQSNQKQFSEKTFKKIQKLQSLMIDDFLYQNPDLTRSVVAQALDLSDGYLSDLLSTHLNTSFNDYINKFRVKHAVKMLNDKKFDLFSIEAIGYDSGFKSKSVFYSAFKKLTQQTPGEYRKSLNLS